MQFRDEEGYPRWTWAWLSGDINRQQGRLDEAIRQSAQRARGPHARICSSAGFDFSFDYEVINLLGQTLFDLGRLRARQGRTERGARRPGRKRSTRSRRTLAIDSENVTAHHNLQLLYAELGDTEKSREHERLHLRYKPDDNAQGRAERLARERYPAANHAAEAVVKYPLQRPGAPGLESTVLRAAAEAAVDHRREVHRESRYRRNQTQSFRTKFDPDTLERDDAIIGVALRWSLAVLRRRSGRDRCGRVLCFGRSAEDKPVQQTELAEVAGPRMPAGAVPHVRFTDVTKQAGITFRHENAANGRKLLPETMGGGCAFFDFDNDGDQDLLFVNSLAHWPWDESKEQGAGAEKSSVPAHRHLGDSLPQRRHGQLRRCHRRLGPRRRRSTAWASPSATTTTTARRRVPLRGRHQPPVPQRGRRQISRRHRASGVGGDERRIGAPAAAGSTTTTTAISICSSATTFTGRANTTKARTFSSPAAAGPTAGRRTSRAPSPISIATTATAAFAKSPKQAGLHIRNPDTDVPLAKSLGVDVRRRRCGRLDRHRRRQRHGAKLPVPQRRRRHVPRNRRCNPASPST